MAALVPHVTFIFAWLFSLPALNKKVPFYLFVFWILLLFLSLRYGYGNDYWAYAQHHYYMYIDKAIPIWQQKEILYKYLNTLVPNFQWLIVIISTFYIYTISRLLKKNLKINQYWFAVLILLINPYLFLVHLSSLRQTIAICFITFAIEYAIKRKLVRYVLLVLIASGFHQSALILLPAYFFLNEKKISKKMMIIICSFLAVLLATPLFDIIINKALVYFPKYAMYLEWGLKNSIRSALLSSFFFLLILFNINKLEGKEIIYGKLALIGVLISILSVKLNMLGRIEMYFGIFLIIAIPTIFSKFKPNLKPLAPKQLLFLIVITIYLLRYVSFIMNNSAGYGLYHTILSM
jgi:hypothetical protein